MNQRKHFLMICLVLMLVFSLSGCKKQESRLEDGFYTVEMSDYNNGWKEFVTIRVSGNKIVTVEYNARNASGFIKSWDIPYMRNMLDKKGTYPNRYTRTYAANFLAAQSDKGIDAVTGASISGGNFQKMASLLMEKARKGDDSLGIVESDK
ncbi:MAG TPA: FMN-binding protein [Lachnoclostridium sp.]|jgi:major membrane immunogen (membrane-anchored lipoprotein)|uniref:FMN-binding protein n=1 Tax=Lacrimispora sp. TaxID=2719234 RepID=UPI000EEC530E|nr:FMN-binding protein [Lacrimispora sp.]HCD42711.1 FMN-binding protein [Lachnoclostridium sp.]